MRGRRPLPTSVKAFRGNPGKRPLPEHEPVPESGTPQCPSWLGGRSKAAWREIAMQLESMRVLTLADRKALELLVDVYSEYRDAREIVRRQGATYESATQTGTIIRPRPEVAIASDAWKRMNRMLVEFGLTPAARSRLSIEPPMTEADREAEEFLFGQRGQEVPPAVRAGSLRERHAPR